ncbi:hypothetical protein QFZ43_005915 [Streptomyces afghaniensis]|nr:hypothetical protein [Streptomyces afghaniensis]
MPADRPAGKRKTWSRPGAENRMPTKSRPASRAWSSSARAHPFAHASRVIPPGPASYIECEVSTHATIAPWPSACSP